MQLLIKGGRIIDPANNLDASADLLCEGGVIKVIGQALSCPGARLIDAAGMWVVPGLIDMHVHLRDPGFPHKETIATGSRAAAAGGFTTICAMPNTNPATDSAATAQYILATARAHSPIHILPVGSITKGLDGRKLAAIDEMRPAGICALSDDGNWVQNADLMRAALEKAHCLSLPVLSHCEDRSLPSDKSESGAVARDIALAEHTGAHIHICHISTAAALRHLRSAKRRGQRVTAEVCPHHFTLCEEDDPARDPNFKMAPPLASRADLLAIRQALADGTIDVIATDHAPHAEADKNCGYDLAANGIIGLETALPLCITELVGTGLLTPSQLIAKLTAAPAQILGINAGTLAVGAPADITIIDPAWEHTIDKTAFRSLARNTPFHGRRIRGKAVYTIIEGKIVMQRGDLLC